MISAVEPPFYTAKEAAAYLRVCEKPHPLLADMIFQKSC